MKYYEIHYPYYALIKAEDENEAVSEYIKYVSGEEDEKDEITEELEEIDRDTALMKFSMAIGEDGELPITEKKRCFNDKDYTILLIDGCLL